MNLPSASKPCLIIVDDDSAVRELLKAALRASFDVIAIPNGSDVPDEVERWAPALILLDAVAPGGDGYDICADLEAHARLRGIPVVHMSVRGERDVFVRSLIARGATVLEKPLDVKRLRREIERLLRPPDAAPPAS